MLQVGCASTEPLSFGRVAWLLAWVTTLPSQGFLSLESFPPVLVHAVPRDGVRLAGCLVYLFCGVFFFFCLNSRTKLF